MKQKLHLSREAYDELSKQQKADLEAKYQLTVAKRYYCMGVA